MTRTTQSLLLTLLGAAVLRLVLFGDAFLRYVNDWMKWPVLVSGIVILSLSMTHLWSTDSRSSDAQDTSARIGGHHSHGEHVPMASWLLVLPTLAIFLIAPPSLGAFQAERMVSNSDIAIDSLAAAPDQSELNPLPPGDPVEMALLDYYVRAQFDAARSLEGRTVKLTGFVSTDKKGNWYLTRFVINCCAADGLAVRLRVLGAEAPARDQWVVLTGRWTGDRKDAQRAAPPIFADEIQLIDPPRNPYE